MITRFAGPFIVLAAVVAIAIFTIGKVGGDDKYVAFATFEDAGGILKNYNVKIGGVTAGTIEGIELDDQDQAVVRMELDEGAAPIGAGASAKVRPVNLLGEKFIDLDPGDPARPLPSGAKIPRHRTDVPIELDDALNILDPDTRGALRILINEAGISLAGRGADFNAVLEELPPAIDAAEKVVTEVAAENDVLEDALVRGDRVLAAVESKSDELGELVESAADALGTVADRRARLGETVRGAPAALSALRTTLQELDGAAGQLTPAARDLRRTTPSLAQTLSRTPAFANDAKETLATATRVSPTLSKLGKESTPTLRAIAPTADKLGRFISDADPLVDALSNRKGFRELLEFMNTWANAIRGKDGLGHHFRIHIAFDEEIISSALARYAGIKLPPVGPKPPAGGADQTGNDVPAGPVVRRTEPEQRTPAPASRTPVEPLLKDVTKGLQDIGTSVEDAVGTVTGSLEKGLKDGLLKGDRRDADPASNDTTKLFNYLLGP